MQTKGSPNQSLQGIPNKLTGEYMYRWPEITSTSTSVFKHKTGRLSAQYQSTFSPLISVTDKSNRELIDFKSWWFQWFHCTLFTSSITPQVTFLTWVASEEVMLSISSSKLVVPTVTNTVFMSAKLPGFSKFTHFSFHLIHIFVVHPRTWQLLPLQSRWRHSYAVQRVMAPPIGPEVFLRGVLCVCVSCSMEKYQFTAYAGRCRFSDKNVKQEQGNMNEKILIIPGIVWFFNIFFTMKHKHNVPCLLLILIILIMVIVIKNYYVISNPESR